MWKPSASTRAAVERITLMIRFSMRSDEAACLGAPGCFRLGGACHADFPQINNAETGVTPRQT